MPKFFNCVNAGLRYSFYLSCYWIKTFDQDL